MCIATFEVAFRALHRNGLCGNKNTLNALRRGSTHTRVLGAGDSIFKFLFKQNNY